MFGQSNSTLSYEKGHVPQALTSPDQLDVPVTLIEAIFLKRVLTVGRESLFGLATSSGLAYEMANAIVSKLQASDELEITGAGGSDLFVSITTKGKDRANEETRRTSYASFAPVGLDSYSAMVRCQTERSEVTMEILQEAFSDLVVSEQLLNDLGPCMTNDGATLLFGPPGTGKTSVAERMIKVYTDGVFVPHTLYVHGELITVFDAAIHQAVEPQPEGIDRRWVKCERPVVVVGGELDERGLEVQYDPVSKIYTAPAHVQSNNGIFVVDDFGRQGVSEDRILNRFIVPFSRSVDILTLNNGLPFTVPFDVKTVFSTNMDPNTLGGGDEAFLRRLPNKCLIGKIDDGDFDKILRIVTKIKKVKCNQAMADYMKVALKNHGSNDLRPYFPGDIVDKFISIAKFRHFPMELTKETIDISVESYFAHEHMGESWNTAAGS